MDIYYKQLILCVLITIVGRSNGQTDPFSVKPENTYGILGRNTTLQCGTNDGSQFFWRRPNDETVADSSNGVYPQFVDKYTLTNVGNTYTLNILNLAQATDDGQYECNSQFHSSTAFAEVILLDSDQLDCAETSDSGDYEDTLEGENIKLECQISYYGLWAPIQDWMWSDMQSIDASNLTFAPLVAYENTYTADRTDNTKYWTVTARFPAPYDGMIPEDVTDVAPTEFYSRDTPNFVYSYDSTVLNVIYGPDTMSISPEQEEYNPGDTINCVTEGNPDPHEKWVDEANKTIVDSGTLLIEPDMEGRQTYSCMATSPVRGETKVIMRTITFNVTIPPTTTTQPTTTPDAGTRDPGDGTSTDSDSGLSDGAIAGIVIGVLVFLIILAIILFFCCVRKAPQKQKEKPKQPVPTITADHIRSGPPKPADNLSYVSEKQSPYNPYNPYAIPNSHHQPPSPYEANNLHYADLALDDTPRSRKPIQSIYTDV